MFKFFQKKDEPEKHRTGRWGERIAAQLLRKSGYRILGQRFRIGRRDELDIVARIDDILVFVEVKTRKDERFGRPASSVNAAKRRVLSRAAVRYVQKLNPRPPYVRFDIIEVIGSPDEKDPVVRHIENAFPLDPAYRLWW